MTPAQAKRASCGRRRENADENWIKDGLSERCRSFGRAGFFVYLRERPVANGRILL